MVLYVEPAKKLYHGKAGGPVKRCHKQKDLGVGEMAKS